MAHKLLAGTLVGGLAAVVAWQALKADQKQAVTAKVQKVATGALDAATDYALEVLDITDGLAADYGQRLSERWAAVKHQTQDQTASLAKAVMKKDFNTKTADLREQLAQAREEDGAADIVIDQTQA